MDAAVAAVKAKVTPELVANVGQVYIFEIGHAVSDLIGALVHSPTHLLGGGECFFGLSTCHSFY